VTEIVFKLDGAGIVVDVSGRRHVSLSSGFTFTGIDDGAAAVFTETVTGAIGAALETLEGPANAERIRAIVHDALELGILALAVREDDDDGPLES
jgi:hypothetical protein